MLPIASGADMANRGRAQPELYRKRTQGHAFRSLSPDAQHVSIGEFRSPAFDARARNRSVASLGHHVAGVVLWRSDEQVCGIAAATVVAAMADEHTVRDRAVRQNPRITVRLHPRVDAGLEMTVSMMVKRSRPLPASGRAGDRYLRPEAFVRRAVHSFGSWSHWASCCTDSIHYVLHHVHYDVRDHGKRWVG